MEWKVIQGFENYEVSNTGDVRNITTHKILSNRKRKSGYCQVGLMKDFNRKMFHIHRLVALAFLENPKEMVDHIDGNTSNNTVTNLRWATPSENSQNKKIPSHSKSGIKGIRFRNQKWEARIVIDGIQIRLGTFDAIEDAREARLVAVQKAFGEFAHVSEIQNSARL